MAKIRFSPYERQLLRERAETAWRRAEELAERTGVARQRSEELAATTAGLLDRSLANLVNRAIAHWDYPFGGEYSLDHGVALVASGNLGELMRFQDLFGVHFSTVVGGSDVGTTLGLAIAAQPEYAVIDAELELGSGVDVALILPTYAPETKVLVLVDDPLRAHEIRLIRLSTDHRFASDAAILAWLDGVAA
jgi:hypothetical protein